MTFLEFFKGFTPGMAFFMVMGFVCLIIELYTPGIGISGVLAMIFFIITIVLRGRDSLIAAIWLIAIVLVVCGICVFLLFRSASKGAICKSPIVLSETINANASYISSEDLQYYVGKEGIAQSALRPSGIAMIEGARINVVTDGEYIERGSAITIDRIDGIRLIVKNVEQEY